MYGYCIGYHITWNVFQGWSTEAACVAASSQAPSAYSIAGNLLNGGGPAWDRERLLTTMTLLSFLLSGNDPPAGETILLKR